MKRGCTLQGLVGTFAKQEFETGTSPLIIAKRRPNWPPFYCSLNVVGNFFCGVSAILRFVQLPFGLVPELIVPSGGSLPRVREHVVGSDLLLAYPLSVHRRVDGSGLNALTRQDKSTAKLLL